MVERQLTQQKQLHCQEWRIVLPFDAPANYSVSIAFWAVLARRKRGIPGSKGSTAELTHVPKAVAGHSLDSME